VNSIIDGQNIPGSYQEINRVICVNNTKEKISNKIFFHQSNEGYKWNDVGELTNIDSIISDSLKELPFIKQLEHIDHKDSVIVDNSIEYEIMPLKFKPATWYHVFGLDGIEGSYFVYITY